MEQKLISSIDLQIRWESTVVGVVFLVFLQFTRFVVSKTTRQQSFITLNCNFSHVVNMSLKFGCNHGHHIKDKAKDIIKMT